MNVEEIKYKLKELHKKQQESLSKRKTLIKEIKSMPFQRNINKNKKLKDENDKNFLKTFVINLDGAKEERAEKQKQLDQKVPIALKEKDRRIVKCLFGNHLQRAKQDLDGEKQKLDKQIEINKRLEDKERQDLMAFKENQDKKKEKLVTERKLLERELAADEFRRQQLLLELQLKTMREFFITKTAPYLLWQPVKTNEGMNPLKEYSNERFNEMEKDLKEKLQKAYQQFIDFQSQKIKEQTIEQEQESSQSESEDSQEKPKEEGQE
ncbi:unnamed protein product (macronuclear) [Paramecium tetraurelia]|uniref:Pinin/SDK/MemA protein domain-containing protein n=1 Tax=Paramecium tetraurelia TaxID=5888 RepID=A0DVE5_PARTE|nr:uncharacterized protein GSPATT00020676001 [Paramecium tetraurelia]CAK87012.1 unnamed protein product [Paramecium tetraurelia]|eukprot:XP_001454409.1 hypothetical protein (macronuclear) [Paramecium tetraurelia strain d4-2]